ncbi:MAG: metallophosphoesterase, partial [Bacteroidota bacterium]
MMRLLAFFLLAAALPGCASGYLYVQPELEATPVATLPTDAAATYRVLLVGDSGEVEDAEDPLFQLLTSRLAAAGDSSTVAFLGDNLLPKGMVPLGHPDRGHLEDIVQAHADALDGYEGRVVIIPGNHDWEHTGPEGLAYVRRTEAAFEAAFGRGDTWLPSNGFPGPIPIELTDEITLIAIDTQWWLHPYERPTGNTGEYVVRDNSDVLVQLEDLLRRYDDTNLVVIGHHPMLSNGRKAGVFPPSSHLFPFRETGLDQFHNVPLPGLGSLALFYNRVIGVSIQDVAHPDNTALRRSFLDLFSDYENLIYASGHDHNLQYHTQTGREGLQHLLVSGGGSEGRYARGGGTALFTASQRGLMELVYVADGSVWLEAYTVDGGAQRPVFRQMVSGIDDERQTIPAPDASPRPAYADSTVVAAVNPDAGGSALRRAVTGSGWREAWTTPVELPVFDLATAEGGLEVVRRGGGLQTRSLRLEQPESGRQYVLRMVDKAPASALPAALRYGVGLDPTERMTTAIHPYAAPVAAALADSLGVYHTTPRYVFVPDDPLLGRYRDDFANAVALLEERPDEDWSDAPHFGGSDNLIGSNRLYREIEEDNDHRVDQEAFLRARLLDAFLGDWDRHRDQWRWASFEPFELDSTLTGDDRQRGKIYRPIPRDRDWALNDRDGIVFQLARRFVDRLAGLQDSYGPIPSLTANGQLLDQRFLSALDRQRWMRIARETQAALTDPAIEAAVRQLPPEVYALHGPELERRMRARRDGLVGMAEAFYEARAARVDIAGSREHERFEVTRRPGETEVVMYKSRRDGEIVRELYRRVFDHGETDELRLYGFDGDDTFVVSGPADGSPPDGGPVVRLIGGGGSDLYDAEGASGGRRTIVYDVRGANEAREADWRLGPKGRFESSARHPELSRVVQEQIDDTTEPLAFAARNANDGVLLGGGVRLTRFG